MQVHRFVSWFPGILSYGYYQHKNVRWVKSSGMTQRKRNFYFPVHDEMYDFQSFGCRPQQGHRF
jgi:hypothetical protein